MKSLIFVLTISISEVFGQAAQTGKKLSPPASQAVPASTKRAQTDSTITNASTQQVQALKAASEGGLVDLMIGLAKGNMSESLLIKTARKQAKGYTLTANDILKLQQAGISEKVIEVLLDPEATDAPTTQQEMKVATPENVTPATKPSSPSTTALSEPAVEDREERKKSGNKFTDSLGAKLKGFGKKQSDRTMRTVDNTVDSTLDTAEKSSNKTMDKAQATTDEKVQKTLGGGQQKTKR